MESLGAEPPLITGRYRTMAQIGVGGMGEVYIAEHLELGRKVAIKVLRAETSPQLVERFRREARATSAIEHENIVDILDVGTTPEGRIYYVMEALKGEDLQTTLRREKRLAWPRVQGIALQICRALAAAHDKGIVHRDLKPGNLFRIQRSENPDFVKILDFGIAKIIDDDSTEGDPLTRTGEVIGTIPYMAPEQASGEEVDHRIDIYATGVILFQLLSGQLPFTGKTPRQILTAILTQHAPQLHEVAPELEVPEGLNAVLQRAMNREPELRHATMLALHDDLAALPPRGKGFPKAERAELPPAAPVPPATPPSSAGQGESAAPPSLAKVPPTTSAKDEARNAPNDQLATQAHEPSTRVHEPSATLRGPAARRRLWLPAAGLALAALLWGTLSREAPQDPRGSEAEVPAPQALPAEAPPSATPPEPVTTPKSTILAEVPAVPDEPKDEPQKTVPRDRPIATPEPVSVPEAAPTRRFEAVLRQSAAATRNCLLNQGLMEGDTISFAVHVAAKTGKISAALPRGLHRDRPAFGDCLVKAAAGMSVSPAPAKELIKPHEIAL